MTFLKNGYVKTKMNNKPRKEEEKSELFTPFNSEKIVSLILNFTIGMAVILVIADMFQCLSGSLDPWFASIFNSIYDTLILISQTAANTLLAPLVYLCIFVHVGSFFIRIMHYLGSKTKILIKMINKNEVNQDE